MQVDVIVPYSSEHTPKEMLNKTIDSINSQTIETNIILVTEDDANNVAKARNYGLDKSNSKYVGFCDADDIWKEDKLEKQVKSMQESNSAVSLTQTKLHDEYAGNPTQDTEKLVKDIVFRRTMSFTSSIVIDQTQINTRFNEDIYRREDHLFLIEAVSTNHFYYLPDCLVSVNKHPQGLSASGDLEKQIESHSKILERAKRLYPDITFNTDNYWANIYHRIGRSYYYRENYSKSKLYLQKSLKKEFSIKTLLAYCISAMLDSSGN